MGADDLSDIEARLASVEERVEALPTVEREEDAAAHAHATFALMRALVLSLPSAQARQICDAALFHIGENPGARFPSYLTDAIADAVRGVAGEIRS